MTGDGGGPSPEAVRSAFGARVELSRNAGDAGFFVVTPAAAYRDDTGRAAFERALLRVVGGREAVFLAEGDVYLVHATLAAAESLRGRPEVDTVGGVNVDLDRLRAALGV